jgi:4-hydroxy-3-methylbut-2-enyl diphosphate reductase
MINIYLASPRWFCAWVHRAINILNGALEKYGAPLFVNHEIIHNKIIVEFFKKKWVIFENNLDKIPTNSIMIFSAHWVSPKYVEEVKNKWLKYIDASCPLVLKVHTEAQNYLKKWYKIIYIWQKKHQEAIWILWEWEDNIFIVENKDDIDLLYDKLKNEKLALLTQTTLSVSDKIELEKYIFSKFKNIEKPSTSDICFATTNRQNAVKKMLEENQINALIIVWSKNSSNSNKLKNIWEKFWIKSLLVDKFEDIEKWFFDWIKNLWISSWASVSHNLVEDLIKKIEKNFDAKLIEEIKVIKEKIDFSFDLELK